MMMMMMTTATTVQNYKQNLTFTSRHTAIGLHYHHLFHYT